jgi:NADH-quinone oxidoreductase subunit H
MLAWLTTQFGFSAGLAVLLFLIVQGCVAYCILLERKVAAWVQDRIGPNRAGPRGLLQPLADGVKLFLKEDIVPGKVDKPMFILAPALSFVVASIGMAVIPWGGQVFIGGRLLHVQVASLDIGLLYILGVASLAVYGLVFGGWASNNKYSFFGAIRSTAQAISYEIPMGLSILVIVMTTGSLRLEHIVADQVRSAWFVCIHPLAFLILLITAFAETNRAPFDITEAEQELVGGFHTEFSSLKWGLFFLAEYANMITNSALMVTLFFGGWMVLPVEVPGVTTWLNASTEPLAAALRCGVYGFKVALFIMFYMWVRWTLPRFRFDQLMRLAWLGLVPIGMALLFLAGLLLYFGWHETPAATLGGNAVILAGALVWTLARRSTITGRQEHLRPVAASAEGSLR